MSEGERKKSPIQAEMLVAVSAVFVGICALGVSLYEAHLMRQEQRAGVLPLLELSRSYFLRDGDSSDRWRLLFQAENVGIGPARILDFQVTVDGQPHATWRGAVNALVGEPIDVNYGQSTINGRTIPADRSVTMFDLADTQHTAAIVAELDRLDFQACYCSVFDECWTTTYQGGFGEIEPVAGCEVSSAFEE
ncbi:MAG: hypothetical protein QNJ40_03295 [Xanthomonadales bacterium]|nr:hypothetical protein [Xanthomonadales bacterium]